MPEPQHSSSAIAHCGGECPWHKKGHGCAHCYDGEPVVASALLGTCRHCLKAWYPNKSYAELDEFIADQLDLAVLFKSEDYKERMYEKDHEDLARWLGIPQKDGGPPAIEVGSVDFVF